MGAQEILGGTSWELGEPRESSRNLRGGQGRFGNPEGALGTSGISGEFREPRGTSWKLGEPWGTSGELGEPRGAPRSPEVP